MCLNPDRVMPADHPLVYAGVGSRSTPSGDLARCEVVARGLRDAGWTLRTGGAPGADQAFETGAGAAVEVYLPWAGFEPWHRGRPRERVRRSEPSPGAYEVARRHHPAWGRLGHGARALLARNAHVVLGDGLDDPARLVVCWWNGRSGGTAHALSIAREAGCEVVNLAAGDSLDDALAAP